MRKGIYLISYMFIENGSFAPGNICIKACVQNTNILNEIVEEIREKTGKKGDIWITNISKL